jgi:2-methylisocitrate lyase-like PEP mutase family enzyme
MKELADLGYQIAAYPLTLLSASMLAMKSTLELMKEDLPRDDLLLDFGELRKNIGFDEYYSTSEKYTSAKRS